MPYEGEAALMWNMGLCSLATSAIFIFTDIRMIIHSAVECVGTDRGAGCIWAVAFGNSVCVCVCGWGIIL